MIDLYKNIKRRRQQLGMTQSELAKKLGYADKSMIAKIEKGNVDLSQSKIVAFAHALEISAGDLMGDTQEEKSTDEPELIVINRAMKKMTPDQKRKMMNILKASFEDEFKDE